MVTMSIIFVLAVSASLSVRPDSFNKFPKNNIPKSGIALGDIKVVNKRATTGKIIFSMLYRKGLSLITRLQVVVPASLSI